MFRSVSLTIYEGPTSGFKILIVNLLLEEGL